MDFIENSRSSSMLFLITNITFNKTFRNKYLVQLKHRLVINNVTADELGVYYCMNIESLQNSETEAEYNSLVSSFTSEIKTY